MNPLDLKIKSVIGFSGTTVMHAFVMYLKAAIFRKCDWCIAVFSMWTFCRICAGIVGCC